MYYALSALEVNLPIPPKPRFFEATPPPPSTPLPIQDTKDSFEAAQLESRREAEQLKRQVIDVQMRSIALCRGALLAAEVPPTFHPSDFHVRELTDFAMSFGFHENENVDVTDHLRCGNGVNPVSVYEGGDKDHDLRVNDIGVDVPEYIEYDKGVHDVGVHVIEAWVDTHHGLPRGGRSVDLELGEYQHFSNGVDDVGLDKTEHHGFGNGVNDVIVDGGGDNDHHQMVNGISVDVGVDGTENRGFPRGEPWVDLELGEIVHPEGFEVVENSLEQQKIMAVELEKLKAEVGEIAGYEEFEYFLEYFKDDLCRLVTPDMFPPFDDDDFVYGG
eukprot:GHVN01070444.1.p1 GENE.GHVN01070444.1~~GHVN01070444.1.p1  ORF type:complete len:330 (+),score=56.16 GHVN01070444.1:81-1070(+)